LTPEERRHVFPLASNLDWDPASNSWRWQAEELGPDTPIVVLTDDGAQYTRGQLKREWRQIP
jgi:hypothetical protein